MKLLLLIAGALTTASLAAQQLPKFDVASVKRNNSGDGFISMSMGPSGPTFTNFPVRQMIVRAYGVQPYQVQGGPSWLTSDRFDITAKAGDDPITPAQMNLMLQSLLADRFKLKIHRETRQSDVYRLVKARTDGRLGESLKPAAVDCSAMGRGHPGGPGPVAGPGGPGPGLGTPVPGPRAGGPQPGPGGGTGGPGNGCMLMMTPGRLQMGGQPISAFVNALANQVGRPVLDETGLTGVYDLTVSFMPDAGGRGGLPPPGAPDVPPIDPNAPALPTALVEQLGLKLEAAKGPVETIVIDSIEPPTED